MDNSEDVEAKFAKEEWKSFHVHYQRFVFEFIPGLTINPIQWVFDKGKGRICIDGTNGPGGKMGSINSHIPSPKDTMHYQFAFRRLLWRILRMRLS